MAVASHRAERPRVPVDVALAALAAFVRLAPAVPRWLWALVCRAACGLLCTTPGQFVVLVVVPGCVVAALVLYALGGGGDGSPLR